jgi:hypothetical protein
MPLITLSLKHDKTLDEAQQLLRTVVEQIRSQFGMLIQKVSWSEDSCEVRLDGLGFWMEMSVDEVLLHVAGDLPLLSQLLGGPATAGIQQIVQQTFRKQLL